MELTQVMTALYNSEINCSISCFWDGHWDVKLGDYMSGFVAEGNFKTLEEAADFLDREARKHYPDSTYAVGEEENRRRQLPRLLEEEKKYGIKLTH